MRRAIGIAFAAVVLAAVTAGCQHNTKLLSAKEIVDDPGTYSSIVDVKIQKYERLVNEFPNEPKHRERLAAFYWQKQDHTRAIQQLEAAKKLDPANGKYDHMEGTIYKAVGNYGLAEAAFNTVISKMPADSRFTGPYYDLAWVHLELDQFPKAVGLLKKCIEIDPIDPLPYYYLGKIALEELNNREQCIGYLEQYLQLGGSLHHDEVHQILIALQPELAPKIYYPTDGR